MLGSLASTPSHEQIPIQTPYRPESSFKPQTILEYLMDIGRREMIDSFLQVQQWNAMRRSDSSPDQSLVTQRIISMNRQRCNWLWMPVEIGNRTSNIHVAKLWNLVAYDPVGMS
jgi:hypothetical protein